MAAKKFNIQFEDIRRGDTPVTAAGFGDLVEDPDNPDEPFIDVDLDEEDPDKAITAVSEGDRTNGTGGAGAADDERERKREALRAKKAKAATDEAINEARGEVAQELNLLHEKIDALEGQKGLIKVEEEYEEGKADIEAKMVEAMEAGKSDEYAKLNSQLIELNGKMSEKRMELKVTTAAPEDLGGGDGGDRQPANPRAVAFIQANEVWWSDPDHDDAVDYARKLDKKLVNMGYDPKSDRYWHAFHRNFDNKFKDLRVADDDEIELDLDDSGGKGKGNRSPVHRPGAGGGASRGAAANRGGGDGGGDDAGGKGSSVVRLTAADKANMTRFLLDPSNPEHCRQYAMNKVPEKRT